VVAYVVPEGEWPGRQTLVVQSLDSFTWSLQAVRQHGGRDGDALPVVGLAIPLLQAGAHGEGRDSGGEALDAPLGVEAGCRLAG